MTYWIYNIWMSISLGKERGGLDFNKHTCILLIIESLKLLPGGLLGPRKGSKVSVIISSISYPVAQASLP